MAAPPWTKLRDLEYASLQLEQDDAENNKDYMKKKITARTLILC